MRVVVLGAGNMGSGIAQLAAMLGHDVVARELDQERLTRARASIEVSLQRFVKAGTLTPTGAAECLARLRLTTSLIDAVTEAEVLIEAVPEVLELKREVLGEAVPFIAPEALIATNTSQLSITRIASALGSAAPQLIGMHFFNPPVLMKLVELICGLDTSASTLQKARSFVKGLGKRAVVCRKDSPGFITSRAYAALRLECVRILEEGLASAEDIDLACKLGFNFPMGPLELGDFNGIDTFVHALDSLCESYGDRFKPTPGLRNMVAAGRLGRKSGRGFFAYGDGHGLVPAIPPQTDDPDDVVSG